MPANAPTRPADRLLESTRWLGFLEGASLLILLLVAMPLKHAFGQPEAVARVGMIHGVLFLFFVAALLVLAVSGSLPWKRALLGLVASVIPGGPWLLDHRIFPPRATDPGG